MPAYKSVSVDQVFVVDNWIRAVQSTTGTREKRALVSPDRKETYLFKFPKVGLEHQIWSELFASFIAGDLLGWEVQHAGIGTLEGKYGSLLRYVYVPTDPELLQVHEPGVIVTTLVEGWNYCIELDQEYDPKQGTRHTLPLLLSIHDQVLDNEASMLAAIISRREYMDFWARTFAFDTLISNTDRHAENWAVIVTRDGAHRTAQMAALYDNGTSLGCGIDRVGLRKRFDAHGEIRMSHLKHLRKNGRHHVRLQVPGKRGAHFESICSAFLKAYPEGRCFFEAAAKVDVDSVRDFMADTAKRLQLPEPYTLTAQRQQHIYAILQIGLQRIHSVLEAQDA